MRRGNKSHKVPNVKLRPAPLPARSTQARDMDASCDRSSDSEVPPNASMVDLCPRPFKGFTLCATGTMDKPSLFKMAFELGAISTCDLTDRVTHLIANAHGGAKYMCALERKLPIMTPDWITEAHAIWLRGDDVDMAQGLSKHRLPIFSGVILSLSGIEDIVRRTEINRLVTAHEGIYLKNLERPVRVTHLLCSGDIETDKMKYAEKFNKHKEAHIHLVWEEWFWDCLEFGGRFDERKYQVSRPRPERKSLQGNPVPSLPVQDSVSGSHRDSAVPADTGDQPKYPKHVAPAGSFTVMNNLSLDGEEEEMAIINKPVPAVTLQIWGSLLKPRGFELNDGKLVRSPSKSQATRPPLLTQSRTQARQIVMGHCGTGAEHGKEKEKESVISSFRRATSFAPVSVKESTIRQPFRRNTTMPAIYPGEAEGSGVHDPVGPEEPAIRTLFVGHTFRLLGEARCPNVRSAIEKGGGVVTDDDTEDSSFIIVRLISGSKLYRDEFDDYARTKYRTECWLEHSVFHERICEPSENVSFTPLKVTTPILDAEKISLSLSGLDQSELCWIRRLARAVGINLEPTFSRRSTHLLCPSGTGAKFDKALEWQIPVISLAWLEDIARIGAIPPVDEYLVDRFLTGESIERDDDLGCAQHLDPVQERKKDKGKAKAVDCQMTDITNDEPMFVKNAGLLQDTAPRVWKQASQHSYNKMSQPRSPARNGLFGKPKFLPHNSDPPEEAGDHENLPTSSPPDPPPQSSSPPAEADLPLPGLTPPILALPAHVTPTHQRIGSMRGTQGIGDAGPHRSQIPSSTSPSPMKLLPSSSVPDAFGSSSPAPARLLDTAAITKALHESLTSLLGKRPVAEQDEREVQKGKRVRPSTISRDASRDQVISPSRPAFRPPLPPPAGELDPSLLDALEMGGTRSTEESVMVTYEDPEQVEEKRRLMRMLSGDEVDLGVGVGHEARRSGVAGNAGRMRRTKRAKVPGF